MYLEHFGLSEAPFRITPHTEFFFSGGNRGATLDALMYAIVHDEGIVKVSGEVGSGKTMLCRVLMERLPATVKTVYLANPSLSRDDILYAIADELHLDIPPNARSSAVMRALQEQLIQSYGEGQQVVVLIDEAHAMPTETLEEIRLLSNLESNRHKLLQLALFGQPELNTVLARADMRQLKERITHNFVLEPLQLGDIASYIEFRLRAAGYKGPMPFTDPAIKSIAKASLGLTRRINILADKALLAAFSTGSHQIGPREARAAIQDTEFSAATGTSSGPPKPESRWLPVAVALAIVGVAAALWLTGILPRSPFSAAHDGPAPTAAMPVSVPPVVPAAPAASPLPEGAPPAATPATVPSDLATSVTASGIPDTTAAAGNTAGQAPAAAAVLPSDASLPAASNGTGPPPGASPALGEARATGPAATETRMAATRAEVVAVPSPAPARKSAVSAPLGPLMTQKLAAWRDWMQGASDERWFVQLQLGDQRSATALEEYLRAATRSEILDPAAIRVYEASVDDGLRYGVIYGEFDSRAAATAAIARLPVGLTGGRPFPRQVRQLR